MTRYFVSNFETSDTEGWYSYEACETSEGHILLLNDDLLTPYKEYCRKNHKLPSLRWCRNHYELCECKFDKGFHPEDLLNAVATFNADPYLVGDDMAEEKSFELAKAVSEYGWDSLTPEEAVASGYEKYDEFLTYARQLDHLTAEARNDWFYSDMEEEDHYRKHQDKLPRKIFFNDVCAFIKAEDINF